MAQRRMDIQKAAEISAYLMNQKLKLESENKPPVVLLRDVMKFANVERKLNVVPASVRKIAAALGIELSTKQRQDGMTPRKRFHTGRVVGYALKALWEYCGEECPAAVKALTRQQSTSGMSVADCYPPGKAPMLADRTVFGENESPPMNGQI